MTKTWEQMDSWERDCLVAEHCFGWRWYSIRKHSYLIPPSCFDEMRSSLGWKEGEHSKRARIELHLPQSYGHLAVPEFTRDIRKAMRVLAVMGETRISIKWFDYNKGDGRRRGVEVSVCQEHPGEGHVEGYANLGLPDVGLAMAEAICLCALRAKGVED